ncbi:hypothetical protein CEXT_255661 [Caerostris extrusa]|uniref:Uncharacterized protein n=1 Tax=Caerostris extrusa TaxID=172846 RepID=A0AAV4QH50_CAEEX|nr:hypothetical protein CEXT_255661 [Caerostris extrusa]
MPYFCSSRFPNATLMLSNNRSNPLVDKCLMVSDTFINPTFPRTARRENIDFWKYFHDGCSTFLVIPEKLKLIISLVDLTIRTVDRSVFCKAAALA